MQLNLERGFGLLLKNNGNCPSPGIEAKLERSLKKFREIKKGAFGAEPSPAPHKG